MASLVKCVYAHDEYEEEKPFKYLKTAVSGTPVLTAVEIKTERSRRVIYYERNDKQSASYLLILSLPGVLA